MKITDYLNKLITAGTGVSSSRFALIVITGCSVLLLLIVAFILVWDIIHNGSIQTDLTGLAAFVGSITTLLASVCFAKAWEKQRTTITNTKD